MKNLTTALQKGNIRPKDRMILLVQDYVSKDKDKKSILTDADKQALIDDEPLQVSIASGGGSSVQSSLIRNGNSVAVVNSDGSSIGGLTPNTDFDYIDIQQTSATVETYVYKQGGSSGTTVQTITVTYTDSTKNDLDKVEYA